MSMEGVFTRNIGNERAVEKWLALERADSSRSIVRLLQLRDKFEIGADPRPARFPVILKLTDVFTDGWQAGSPDRTIVCPIKKPDTPFP